MNYRDFFEKALAEAYREAPVTDDRTFVGEIDERARNMKNSNERKHRVFGAVAGTAAAVAMVGGSVLGVNFLNEHGGLKEGGGAAYQAENEPSVTTNALMSAADIAEANAKTEVPATFVHETAAETITVNSYEFDGKTLNINCDTVFDNELEKYYKPESRAFALVDGMKNMDAFSFMGEPDENIKYVFVSTNIISDRTINQTMTVVLEDYADSLDLIFPPTVHDEFNVPEYTFTATVNAENVTPAVNEETGKMVYHSDIVDEDFVLSDAQTEKQTTIAIDLSRIEAEAGDFDLWFYIDGALQEELTRTIDFPGEERIEWDISAETGIHEYRIDVLSRSTGEVGTLFRGQVDFTNDTPQKLFGEGDDMEFNSGVFRKLNEALHGDPSQIAGIYPPEEGWEPPSEEEIEALVAQSTEKTLAQLKEKSPVLFDLFYNNQDLYASSSDPWLYGDEAWAVLAERGGLDGEYNIKGRENMKDKFTFCHSEFFIEDGGLPVYPFTGGTVEYADWYQGWGRLVLVHSDDGHYWLYYHLADIGVREGDTVTTDTVLGNSGSTGFTEGIKLGIMVY